MAGGCGRVHYRAFACTHVREIFGIKFSKVSHHSGNLAFVWLFASAAELDKLAQVLSKRQLANRQGPHSSARMVFEMEFSGDLNVKIFHYSTYILRRTGRGGGYAKADHKMR